MAFSSCVPSYNLDHHPHPNWQQLQQQGNHQEGQNSQLPPPTQVSGGGGGGGGGEGLIRPGSMVDRVRLAKLPLPEAGLNCPRCDSTNTKFCYFNNYSLTQPRHFCKTCRRYWTRGGALRSVPVGGGCRRNKRTKSRTSKSSITGDRQTGTKNNSVSDQSPSSCSSEMTNHFSPQVPLMAALQNLGHYGSGNFGGFQAHMVAAGGSSQPDMGFQLSNGPSGNNNILSCGGAEGWRLPILAGFEQPGSNLFSYQGEGIEPPSGPVKIEENRGDLNLSRQFLGVSENNNTNQYWGGHSWATDFSSGQLNTSSTSHFV